MPAPNHIADLRQAAVKSRLGKATDVYYYVLLCAKAFFGESDISRIILSRVADLQSKYQAGQLAATTEDQAVSALDKLAFRARLPEHGKTNALEFRLLRLQMLQLIPELNPKAAMKFVGVQEFESGVYNISCGMEPAEMLYLIESLVFQKLFNPHSQLTFDELQDKLVWLRVHPSSASTTASGNSIYEPKIDKAASYRMVQTKNALFAFATTSLRRSDWSMTVDEFLQNCGYID